MALKRWTIDAFDVAGTPAVTKQTLLTAASAKETILLSLLISNYSTTNAANITYEHTDGTNVLFTFNATIPAGNSPLAIDSKIVLEPGDKIDITSDIDKVSVIASGDES